MLCISTSRSESVARLRKALGGGDPADGLALVLGGAAMTPAIARELRGTYADDEARRRRRTAPQAVAYVSPWVQAALAGGAAAAVWGLVEPLDRRVVPVPVLGHRASSASSSPGGRAGERSAGTGTWRTGRSPASSSGRSTTWIGGNAFWLAILFALVEHLSRIR